MVGRTRSQRAPQASQAARATQAGSSRRARVQDDDDDDEEEEHIPIDASDDGYGDDDKASGVSLSCRA